MLDAALDKTLRDLQKAQDKLDETMVEWTEQNQFKEEREKEAADAAKLAEFNNRKAQREQDLQGPQGEWEDAKTAFEQNQTAISNA